MNDLKLLKKKFFQVMKKLYNSINNTIEFKLIFCKKKKNKNNIIIIRIGCFVSFDMNSFTLYFEFKRFFAIFKAEMIAPSI